MKVKDKAKKYPITSSFRDNILLLIAILEPTVR